MWPKRSQGFLSLDAFQNVSDTTKHSHGFEIYNKIKKQLRDHPYRYFEAASLDGDWLRTESDSWALDKYKFVPLMWHAFITNPHHKWYIVLEDDTYVFWHGLLRHLQTLDHQSNHWLGQFSWRLGETFAHGGAGMVFSHEAMQTAFGNVDFDISNYDNLTAQTNVGDYVLGHLMSQSGSIFERAWWIHSAIYWGTALVSEI